MSGSRDRRRSLTNDDIASAASRRAAESGSSRVIFRADDTLSTEARRKKMDEPHLATP